MAGPVNRLQGSGLLPGMGLGGMPPAAGAPAGPAGAPAFDMGGCARAARLFRQAASPNGCRCCTQAVVSAHGGKWRRGSTRSARHPSASAGTIRDAAPEALRYGLHRRGCQPNRAPGNRRERQCGRGEVAAVIVIRAWIPCTTHTQPPDTERLSRNKSQTRQRRRRVGPVHTGVVAS